MFLSALHSTSASFRCDDKTRVGRGWVQKAMCESCHPFQPLQSLEMCKLCVSCDVRNTPTPPVTPKPKVKRMICSSLRTSHQPITAIHPSLTNWNLKSADLAHFSTLYIQQRRATLAFFRRHVYGGHPTKCISAKSYRKSSAWGEWSVHSVKILTWELLMRGKADVRYEFR